MASCRVFLSTVTSTWPDSRANLALPDSNPPLRTVKGHFRNRGQRTTRTPTPSRSMETHVITDMRWIHADGSHRT